MIQITVAALLEDRGQLVEVGGRDALQALAATTPAPSHAPHYAELIKAARNGDGPAQGLDSALGRVEGFVRRFVVLTDDQACAIALWAAHTHAIEAFPLTAYLSITSPEKRSGKTRLLEVLRLLVANPWLTGGTTKAALVRKMDRDCPTLLLDESDAAFNGDQEYSEALRQVLNNGFCRGIPYTTCVGNSHDLKDFDVFGAKAIAGIGKLPDTVEDRSVAIRLKRRSPSETVERFRERRARPEGERISEALAQVVEPLAEELGEADPDLPESLSDRAQDIWEPLLAIADAAGGGWPTRARQAAEQLFGQEPEDDTLGIRLLADCRTVFEERDRMASRDLLAGLHEIEEAPWGSFKNDKPLSRRTFASILGGFEIRSRSIRLVVRESTVKGFLREQFEDAWARYLPSYPAHRHIGSIEPKTGDFETAQESLVPDRKKAANPHSNADVPGVPVREPENTENDDSGQESEEEAR